MKETLTRIADQIEYYYEIGQKYIKWTEGIIGWIVGLLRTFPDLREDSKNSSGKSIKKTEE